jgi:hypothetical protein
MSCEGKGKGEGSGLNLNIDRERGRGSGRRTADDGLAIGGRWALRVVGPRNGKAIEGGGRNKD